VLKWLMIALLVWLGFIMQFAWPWFAGVGVAAALFARQQFRVRTRDRGACFAAFINNNWVGLVIWLGLVIAYAVD
jgi:4-hydroxybenzoate polyprenyltransferase